MIGAEGGEDKTKEVDGVFMAYSDGGRIEAVMNVVVDKGRINCVSEKL